MRLRYSLIAIVTLLAACAGMPLISQTYVVPTYSPNEFSYAAAGRDLRVVVAGNPFVGGDQAAFGRAVTDAMQGKNWGPRTNFTTTPGPSARELYRVVLLFGPPLTLNVVNLCGMDPAPLANQYRGGGVEVMAAYCRADSTRSGLTGNIGGATGPDDPAFRALIGQLTVSLFPPDRNRQREREKGGMFLFGS